MVFLRHRIVPEPIPLIHDDPDRPSGEDDPDRGPPSVGDFIGRNERCADESCGFNDFVESSDLHGVRPFFCSDATSIAQPLRGASFAPVPYAQPSVLRRAPQGAGHFSFGDSPTLSEVGFPDSNEKRPVVGSQPGVLRRGVVLLRHTDVATHYLPVSIGFQGDDPNTLACTQSRTRSMKLE